VLTIGLFPNPQKPQAAQVCAHIHEFFSRHSCNIFDIPLPEQEGNQPSWNERYHKVLQSLDMAITIGGDGTLLSTIRCLEELQVPVIGVNLGTVGVMTQVEVQHLEEALQALLEGNYALENRLLLEVTIADAAEHAIFRGYVLNDVVVSRSGPARMIAMDVKFSPQAPCLHYRADGIIIATSTGSTAYSLAAGGPVVHPNVQAMLVTPICPHAPGSPAIVVPGTEQLEVRLAGRRTGVLVTLDGQTSQALEPGHVLRVFQSKRCARFINLAGWTYYHTLAHKLW